MAGVDAAPLALHDAAGQDIIIEPQLSKDGAVYYNLSALRKDDETCVVFIRDDGFTFTTNQINRRKTGEGKEYTYWGKNNWFATRIKRNTRGLTSVNLFRRSASGNLQNVTRSSGYMLADMPRAIREAYALFFKEAYLRVAGIEPPSFDQIAATFLNSERYNALGGFVRAYAYPAAYDCEQQRRAAGFGDKSELQGYARDIEEYFKESSWERVIQKLFGKHLPVEVKTMFQPASVNIAQLEGAYIVRSLVPPQELPKYRLPVHRDYEAVPLNDIRRALRMMPADNRAALLKAWREDQLVVNAFMANVRTQALNRISRMHLKPLYLQELEEVGTWGQLTRAFLDAYDRELQAIADEQHDAVVELRELMAASFTSSEPDDIHLELDTDDTGGNRWSLSSQDMYNTRLKLIEANNGTRQFVNFHMKVFLWRRPFAHGNPLNRFHKQLIDAAPKTSGKRNVIQLRSEVALPIMQELIESLDSLLRRYGVPRTPRNRTRLLVASEVFYNTVYRNRQPKMGKNFYAMLASDYALPAVYEAHILDMTPEEYAEFALFPDTVRANMTRYNAQRVENDWF